MIVTYRGQPIDLPANLVLLGWCFVTFALAWGLNFVGLPLIGGLVALLCMILMVGFALRVLKQATGQLLATFRRNKD